MLRLRRKAALFRPSVETLEARNLLSTFTVDHLADDLLGTGLNGSLRYCITQAADGDRIQFGVTGTINLTGALPDLRHSISIEGPGPDQLTVRRDTGGNYRIFAVDSGTLVSISGLTISNGSGGLGESYGGGVYNNGGTVTLNNATYGSGIFNTGTLTITSSMLSRNGAGDDGGGIWNSGNLTLTSSMVSMNGAGYGGGIESYSSGTLTVTRSILSDNFAEFGGGGINSFGGTLIVTDCTISLNYVLDIGGGGGILSSGTLTVTDSTLSHNSAYSSGGGIWNSGSLTLTSSTLSGNSVSGSQGGGGIYRFSGTVTTRNSIIAGNMAPTAPDLSGSLGSLGYNLIGNTQGGSGFDPTDLLNIDPLLGPLQDNGGPTQTMALLPGSPALNAGDPSQLGTPDQRGVVRAGGVNIGAYQASATAFLASAPDTVQSGVPFDVTVTAVDPFGLVASATPAR
jgi:hypothetical protein